MSYLLFPEMNESDDAKKCLLEVWPDCPLWLLSDEMDTVFKAMHKFKQYGEPTIKTDNTKVIAHLESELEKAKELLKKYIDQNRISKDGLVTIIDRNVFVETITFFEGK